MAIIDDIASDLVDLMFEQDPLHPSLLGLPGAHDALADLGESVELAFRDRYLAIADRAEAVDPGTLSPTDRVTRAVVIHQARSCAEAIDVRSVEYVIIDFWVSPAPALLAFLPMLRLSDEALASALLGRLAAIPAYLEQVAERHRIGIAAGRTPVRRHVEGMIRYLDRYLADERNDPLRGIEPPDGVLPDFARRRDELLADVVRPAFARYQDVLANEVAGHGRPDDRAGLCWLPGGDELYRTVARMHTTTDRTPDDLHETGLALIDGLAREYAEIGGRVFGTTDVTEIFARLRTDPALRWESAEQLLSSARTVIERAEREAPKWFGRMPGQRCQVRAVPEVEEPGAAAAYYMAPALDGSRPGTFYANTGRVTERFRYQSEAFAFHEAVPGHHFQITIAQELTDLPLLRRIASATAYVEGWGLYSERLADEMGLYTDDVTRLGMLALDSMRAGRLVVDTGLHAKGWSRQQAVDYLTENTPMPDVEIQSEVDRYIAYAGQALAYMVGRLEILRLRDMARERLGDRFDIRAFHDLVLGSGALPLSVLDGVVSEWAETVPTTPMT